jgi:hypothetical protein
MVASEKTVFISYAKEDAKIAKRLYKDLRNSGLTPCLGKDAIKPGLNWKIAIRKAITNSRYFIPLFSSNSIEKRGSIQTEFKFALDNYDQFPESQIYIIPARLDNCQIPYDKLKDIQYVDLFPDWSNGITKILSAMDIEANESQEKREEWKAGLSDKDWNNLLISICERKCIPFIGAGVYVNGDTTIFASSKEIIDHWKEKYHYPLNDLYDLARVYTLEDSYQLARLAQFLELERDNPRDLLSDMIKEIDNSDFYSRLRNNSPYKILASLDLPIYITTNYDHFLEGVISRTGNKEPCSDICRWNDNLNKYSERIGISPLFGKKQHYIPSRERPLVYHILGDINTPQSMVITERDYFEYVINLNKYDEKDVMPPYVRTGLGRYSLLFIGYSLEDIYFHAIFQGFLSFLTVIPTGYRKLSIAVQIPPSISKDEHIKMQKYLDKYTKSMFDVKVYWGSTAQFIQELHIRWEEFKNKVDIESCKIIK